jgi:hypothetical protein
MFGEMRSLLGLSSVLLVLVVGCSNACPTPPPICTDPPPDHCPCIIVAPDTGPRPDAYVEPQDAGSDAADIDADVDAAATDDAGSDAAPADDANVDAGPPDDANVDAHHP